VVGANIRAKGVGKLKIEINEGKKSLVLKHWGGEGALVLALKKMPSSSDTIYRLCEDDRCEGGIGIVYQGRGFIGEIQSLFYPQFNSDEKDLLTRARWLCARENYWINRKSVRKCIFRHRWLLL
jgi:hypothetical protein